MIVYKLLFFIGFILCVYTYFLYPLILKFSVKKKEENKDENFYPDVSFVIPVFNEILILEEKIKNTLSLEYPKDKIEVIIASDGSNDGSNEIAEKYHERNLFSLPKRKGKPNLINKVMENVKSDIVIFSDASAILEKDSIKKLVRHFKDSRIGCVSGRYIYLKKKNNARSHGEGIYWKYETKIKELENNFVGLLGAHGAFYALRKSAFTKVREDTINDDYVIPMLVWEKGYKCLYEPEAKAIEIYDAEVKTEIKRRIRIGMGNIQQIFILKKYLSPWWRKIWFCFLSHKVLRTFIPIFLIVMLFSSFYFSKPLFIFQLCFYTFSLFSLIKIKRLNILKKISTMIFYFTIGNFSLLVGILRYLFVKKNLALWEKI
jgi:cellulose synthase/poly-beta-1,6-N-acetylglucosamine synthase-like glycosyltransferase